MYSVNGIFPLDNDSLGWLVLEDSEPLLSISHNRQSYQAAGRDGSGPDRGYVDSPVLPFIVETPTENLEALRSLLREGQFLTRTADPAQRRLYYELMTSSPETIIGEEYQSSALPPEVGYGYSQYGEDAYGDFGVAVALAGSQGITHLTVALRVPGVYWRDAAASTSSPVVLTSDSQYVGGFFRGMSAPVRDAVIRVKGGFLTLLVGGGGGGSLFYYGQPVSFGQYFRFECATGRAFVTNGDTWSGGVEVTSQIGYGPGPYFYEVYPFIPGADPRIREGHLEVFTTGRSSNPTVQVRGSAAYER